MLFMVLLALPGILWAARNLAVLGAVFTPAASALQADSILSNLGKTPAKLTVDPCLAGLGVKAARASATDPMTNTPLPLTADGKVSVTVPAKGFALILLD